MKYLIQSEMTFGGKVLLHSFGRLLCYDLHMLIPYVRRDGYALFPKRFM